MNAMPPAVLTCLWICSLNCGRKLKKRARETIELEGEVVGDQLVFSLPEEGVPSVVVQDNQIFLGDRRIVVRLKGKSKAA